MPLADRTIAAEIQASTGHADDLIAGMAKAGEETDREYPARRLHQLLD